MSRSLPAFLLSIILLLLAAAAFAGLARAGTDPDAPPPSISSDKADYAPGELVTLHGSNWVPGESVNLVVNDGAGHTWRRDVDVVADGGGSITDQFNLPDWFVAEYSVVATGAQSGTATTSFTDASVNVGNAVYPYRLAGGNISFSGGGFGGGNHFFWNRALPGGTYTYTGATWSGSSSPTFNLALGATAAGTYELNGNDSGTAEPPSSCPAGSCGRYGIWGPNQASFTPGQTLTIAGGGAKQSQAAGAANAVSVKLLNPSNSQVGSTISLATDANGAYSGTIRTFLSTDPSGTWKVEISSGARYDSNTNFTSSTNIEFAADTTPPTTTATPAPAANAAGWHKSSLSVSLSANDNAGGSGVMEITYAASGAQTIASTTASGSSVSGISITAEGTTTLSFFAKDNAGNTEATKTLVVKLDKTAPTVDCAAADGLWHADNVDVACTAADSGSGLADPADTIFDLTTGVDHGEEEGNASTGTHTVRDAAGNESTAGPVSGNQVDRKAPQLAGCDTAADAWHAGNVTLECRYTDSGSGPASQDVSLVTNVASGDEDGDAPASAGGAQACDAVDNCAASPADITGNKVDRKAPQVDCTIPDQSSWHADNVEVPCTASDGGSDLANAADAGFTLSTDVNAGEETDTATTESRTVADAVGNDTTAGPYSFKVDRKAPQLTGCDTADGVWHAGNVTLECRYTDGGSGPAGQTVELKTSVGTGEETGDAAASANGARACDTVENCAASAADIGGNKIDRKAPSVSLTCPTGAVIKGSSASASWSAVDGGSGVAGAESGTISLDTSSVGSKTADLPAGFTKDDVGNESAAASCSFSVVYDWRGFFQPIDNNPDQSGAVALATVWNSAKAGQAIPVKFSLSGNQGMSIFEAGYPKSTKVACPTSAPVLDTIETYAASNSGLQYEPTSDQYNYPWKTATTLANTCQRLDVKLEDGTYHYAFFRFVK